MSELELRTWFDDVAVPEGTVEMLATVAREAVAPFARARRRRRATAAAVAAALAAAGAAVAYELLDDDGLSVPSGPPPAREARLDSPLLSQLPWLFQPSGAPRVDEVPAQPSLAFPAGTTHEEALRSLFASVVGEGALPAGTRLGPPLPGRAAVALDPQRGVRIDLRAPWGYAVPTGRIQGPGLHGDRRRAADHDPAGDRGPGVRRPADRRAAGGHPGGDPAPARLPGDPGRGDPAALRPDRRRVTLGHRILGSCVGSAYVGGQPRSTASGRSS